MKNAELIQALRYCAMHECCDESVLEECKYSHKWKEGEDCNAMLLADAADAIEAADKRIAELEDDLRNSTISNPERFKIYGYTVKDLLLFADMCKRNDVREADLKQAAWNLELAVRAVQNERMEIVKKWSDEMSNSVSVRFIPNFEKAFAEMRGEHDEQIH